MHRNVGLVVARGGLSDLGARTLGLAGLAVLCFVNITPALGQEPTQAPALAQEPTPATVAGQEPTPTPTVAPEPAKERSTGLPGKVSWTFNLNAGFTALGFANSLYQNPRPDPSGDLGDDWFEGFVKPALSATYALGTGELYGALSVVGERTFGTAPPAVGGDASSFKPEDLYIGWRSGKSIGGSENLLDFKVGRAQYGIGTAMLLWDGGGEGGSRGGYWSNARRAWDFAAVGRVKPGAHTFEAFYVDRDEVPENDTHTKAWGANYELALGDATTLGASYMQFQADEEILPARDGLDIINFRAYTAPFPGLKDLRFEFEYALEDNGDLRDSTAWTAKAAYQLSDMAWKPRLSYRYAFFEGDDPETEVNEAFDSPATGFYDFGTWFQGEIGGGFVLPNSNLITHQFRAQGKPSDAWTTILIGYFFQLDEPASFGEGVTSKDALFEIDGYAEWKLNANFTLLFVGAWATPQEAAEQSSNRTEDFFFGAIYLGYAY